MRLITAIIAIILWLLLGYFIRPCFNCGSEGVASTDTTEESSVSKPAAAIAKTAVASGPLVFNWNKGEAVTGEGWDTRRAAILDRLKEGQALEITGLYRADEAKPADFDNLGLARASEVAKLFKPPLTDEQIRLNGKLTKGLDTDKSTAFKSVEFDYLKNTKALKQIDDRMLIYFPFSSVNKLNNKEVEDYLNDVAEQVKQTGERVRLTGHTDSVSSKASNQRLGQRRANIVRDYLLRKGVKSSQIIAESKGEMEPVSGQYQDDVKSAKNRRTELQIIK